MLIKYLNPHEEPPVKRRLRDKSVDVDKIFKPPEEPPVKTRNDSTKPSIKVVPVKTPTQHFYIADDIDPKTITLKELKKYTSKKLSALLEKVGVDKEPPINVKGQLVKKRIEKINKAEKLNLIRMRLNL